jgi:hypothetical protein
LVGHAIFVVDLAPFPTMGGPAREDDDGVAAGVAATPSRVDQVLIST